MNPQPIIQMDGKDVIGGSANGCPPPVAAGGCPPLPDLGGFPPPVAGDGSAPTPIIQILSTSDKASVTQLSIPLAFVPPSAAGVNPPGDEGYVTMLVSLGNRLV